MRRLLCGALLVLLAGCASQPEGPGTASGTIVGEPTAQSTFMGTVIHQEAYDKFKRIAEIASQDGVILAGGKVLTGGELAHGYYVTPTIVEGLQQDHELMREELFLPVLCLAPVASLRTYEG